MTLYFITSEPADCGALPDPVGGTVCNPSTTEGSVARYFCEAQRELDGPSTRTCQQNGQWSARAPVCKGNFDWYTQTWYQ